LWEANQMPGADVKGEVDVAWVEVATSDLAVSSPFYAALNGLEAEPQADMPGDALGYHFLSRNRQPVAGIEQMPEDTAHPHWMVYFQVEDTDAAYRALEAGGQPLREPWNTPFGRMALVSDNTAGVFAMMGPVQGQAAFTTGP
jgi:uncharacterized protein